MNVTEKPSANTKGHDTPRGSQSARSITWFTLSLCFLTALSFGVPGMAVGELNKIGGNGGKPFTLQCPSGQFAMGMAARFDGNKNTTEAIIQLNLRCVSVNPTNGNWAGTPRWVGYSPTDRWQGTKGLQSMSVSCPNNEFIESFVRGKTGKVGLATVVKAVEWHCVRFSQIETTQGTSRRTRGEGQFWVGNFFFGQKGQPQQSRDGSLVIDTALHALSLNYGLAVDSVRVSAHHMPWAKSSQAIQPSSAQQRAGRSPGTTKRPPTAAAQPDLTVRLTSTLWRYAGTTRRSGITYNKVPEAFCSSGMIPQDGNRSATKTFFLPDIQYEVKNSGSAATNRNFNIQTTFGTQVGASTAPILQPGQRRNLRIAREQSVRRCVTNGGVLGGCHECAGQSNFQDPPLEIIVDTANVIAEADENNNQLTQ